MRGRARLGAARAMDRSGPFLGAKRDASTQRRLKSLIERVFFTRGGFLSLESAPGNVMAVQKPPPSIAAITCTAARRRSGPPAISSASSEAWCAGGGIVRHTETVTCSNRSSRRVPAARTSATPHEQVPGPRVSGAPTLLRGAYSAKARSVTKAPGVAFEPSSRPAASSRSRVSRSMAREPQIMPRSTAGSSGGTPRSA